MTKYRNHKELDVWKKSMDLVELIYKITQTFPNEEKFGITSQMRRAVVSIPSNIAEGAGRGGDKECVHFLNIALGSLYEVDTQYEIAVRVHYTQYQEEAQKAMEEVKKMIIGYRNYLIK